MKAEDRLYCSHRLPATNLYLFVPRIRSPVFNHIQYIPLSFALCIPTNSRRQSPQTIGQGAMSGRLQATERIDQGAISSDSQRQRYASFSCFSYWLMSKHGPPGTVHVLHPSTSLTMIPFSMCFIFIGHLFSAKIRMVTLISGEGMVDGPAHTGGICSRTFAKDGERSYSAQHLTWSFPLSVQMARPLPTC